MSSMHNFHGKEDHEIHYKQVVFYFHFSSREYSSSAHIGPHQKQNVGLGGAPFHQRGLSPAIHCLTHSSQPHSPGRADLKSFHPDGSDIKFLIFAQQPLFHRPPLIEFLRNLFLVFFPRSEDCAAVAKALGESWVLTDEKELLPVRCFTGVTSFYLLTQNPTHLHPHTYPFPAAHSRITTLRAWLPVQPIAGLLA